MRHMCQDSEEYLLPVMFIGAVCIFAGCCTVSQNFQSPPLIPTPVYFIFPTPLQIRTPPLIWDLRGNSESQIYQLIIANLFLSSLLPYPFISNMSMTPL